MMSLVRMNALSSTQWETILKSLYAASPANAGIWNIDWSDDISDCES